MKILHTFAQKIE